MGTGGKAEGGSGASVSPKLSDSVQSQQSGRTSRVTPHSRCLADAVAWQAGASASVKITATEKCVLWALTVRPRVSSFSLHVVVWPHRHLHAGH